MRIIETRREDLKGALLVVGFQGRGLVGPIVSSYVIEELDMWPVATLEDARLPPTVVVRQGLAEAPVRFYVSATRCGPDGRCDKLVVMHTEIPLEPAWSHDAAHAILEWARKKGIAHVIAIEGVEGPTSPPSKRAKPALFGVTAGGSLLTLEKLKVDALPDGLVTSHASAFLLAAAEFGLEVAAIFAQAGEGADAEAAATSLARIDPLLPNLNLGSREFAQRVKGLVTERRKRVEDSARQMKQMRRHSEMMYQ